MTTSPPPPSSATTSRSDFDLGLVARYTHIDLRNTGDSFDPVTFASFPAPEQTDAKTDEYFSRLFAHLNSFDGFLEQTIGFAYSHERTSTFVPESPEALNTGDRRKADWQGNLHLAAGETLVLGAEYQRDQIKDPLYASDRIASGYAELQSQLSEHWYSAVNVRYDDHNRFGSKVTYRFAPAYVIDATGTKLKASIGSGFKAPTLSELYQDFPAFFFFANPNLKPETSTGWDAGFEQGLAADTLHFGATYFHNGIHDLISTATDPLSFETTYVNIGRATTYGVESFIAWQPLRTLTLRIDYTYTEARDDLLHEELLRRPKNKGNFTANWQLTSAWQVNADVLWVGTWVDGNRDFSIGAAGCARLHHRQPRDPLRNQPHARGVRPPRQPVRPPLPEPDRIPGPGIRRVRGPQCEAIRRAVLAGAEVLILAVHERADRHSRLGSAADRERAHLGHARAPLGARRTRDADDRHRARAARGVAAAP